MHRPSNILRLGCGCALLALAAASPAQEAVTQLRGNIPAVVSKGVLLDRLDANFPMRFSITLPPRDQAGADALLQRIYTPGDPLFHHFLKTGEFAARFGPSQADYDAVIAFAQQQGLKVADTHTNRTVLELTGSASQIEKTFRVRMMRYHDGNLRVFHAPDAEPSVPASIAAKISGIVGLDDALEPKCNLVLPPGNGLGGSSGIGSGPNQGLAPSDIKAAYDLNVLSETGVGQTLALFELDGYLTNDISSYRANFGIPNIPVQNVSVDGVQNVISALTNSGPVEVTLDIQLAMAISTNLAKILVYQGNSYVDMYTKIADDNIAQQVSTSWYSGRDVDVSSSITNGENTAFKMMAMQGQTFYAASGDYGANVRTGTSANGSAILKFGVQDPSAQPFVTGVGGTTLATKFAGGPYLSETAWAGSGGGISGFWTLPNYQSSVPNSGSSGSATFRNVPDVSLCSDPATPYAIYYNGSWSTVGGTSCAAPLWAGFTALVNQRRVNNAAGRLGFLNPTLYYLGNSVNYLADFKDITSGNNGTYAAVTRFDNVTGWGSFDGGALSADLQVDASVLYVDGNYGGSTQNGAISTPYKTVTAAVTAASSFLPTLIYVKGFSYLENLSISKPIIMVNNGGGNVRIGN